ncbi:hypothetical protein Misp05_19360 [Micromonospora sp. NBRC 107095]|nr:hypothetical protein Misp05_19360 [Micromonospora sp. NBRC 107095]
MRARFTGAAMAALPDVSGASSDAAITRASFAAAKRRLDPVVWGERGIDMGLLCPSPGSPGDWLLGYAAVC